MYYKSGIKKMIKNIKRPVQLVIDECVVGSN